MSRMLSSKFFSVLLYGVFPLVVFAVIWVPEVLHYYVPTEKIAQKDIEFLKNQPSQKVLDELQQQTLSVVRKLSDDQLLTIADKIINGRLSLPGVASVDINFPFNQEELLKGSPTAQLILASMVVSEILVDAYNKTGKELYFDKARERVMAWTKFERQAWFPTGFLWDDHAIAARVMVFSKFWRVYRRHSSFQYSDAQLLIQAVSRGARFLAKDDHYTYSTNHGVMQNLALLYVAVAFPKLAKVEQYKNLAVKRLHPQLKFYINDEGVVLEHSSGYHELGVILVGSILRNMTLLGMPIPPVWREKYEKATQVYNTLLRPDGTLPMIGNSSNLAKTAVAITQFDSSGQASVLRPPPERRPRSDVFIAPVAGYALWWDGLEHWPDTRKLSQTVTTWSYFEGHGHKHADEMSVLLWAKGQSWWSNVGYWPYGREHQAAAISWSGSNAPHLVGEQYNAVRSTELLNKGVGERSVFLELARTRLDGFSARRQLMRLGDDLWLIIDAVDDSRNRPWRNIWTSFPNVIVQQTDLKNIFSLYSAQVKASLGVSFISSENISIDKVTGGESPLAGWLAMSHTTVVKAPAFVVEQASNSWALTVWKLVNGSTANIFPVQPQMDEWGNVENWSLKITTQDELVTVVRKSKKLTIDYDASHSVSEQIRIKPTPNVAHRQQKIRHDFIAANTYGAKYKDYYGYRVQMSVYILLFLVAQIGFFLVIKKYLSSLFVASHWVAVLLWMGVGVWLQFVYFSA